MEGEIIITKSKLKEKFKEEYAKGLSERWDEIIDWEKRRESENGFFEKILQSYGAKKVLDIGCGTGFHSIQLAKAGFEVKAADGSEAMLTRTEDNARIYDVDLEIEKADWLNLTSTIKEQYDAVICLGNALTHLFEEKNYRRALHEIYGVLNDGGILIADQRNYDSILDKGYSSKHQYYYCGNEVAVKPVIIHEDFIRFSYRFTEDEVYYLTLHPIRKEKFIRYILGAGFRQAKTFGDFQKAYDEQNVDFFVHVAQK